MKPRREYSKTLTTAVVGVILTVAVGFIGFCCYEMHRLSDLSPVAYIGPSIVGVLATSVGAYMWRAKCKSKTDLEWEQTRRMTELRDKHPDGLERGGVTDPGDDSYSV